MNLITDPWIEVLAEGDPAEMPLREVLLRAHEVEDLSWADPLVGAATLSLLTAIVMDSHDIRSVDGVGELWEVGHLDRAHLNSYLDEHRDRFDLFSPTTPFLQVASLEPVSGSPKSVALLQPEVASGNNTPLFAASTETATPPLTPAAAARRLVALMGYDSAAIKTGAKGDPAAAGGKTSGNPTGPLGAIGYVAPIGRSLFETVVLNLPARVWRAGDAPAWRRDPPGPSWTTRLPAGPLDLATWQSRRVRLHPEGGLVTGVVVSAGDRLPHIPDVETRTGWVKAKESTQGGPALRPRRHQSGRSAWRGLAALLAGPDLANGEVPLPGVLMQLNQLVMDEWIERTHPIEIQIVGVEYGNMSAVIEHVVSDRTPFPIAALDPAHGSQVKGVVTLMGATADAVARALNDLGDNLRRAAGGEKIPWDKGQRLGELFLHRLNAPAWRMLAGLAREPRRAGEVREVWEQVCEREAWSLASPLLDEAPVETFHGHREGDRTIRLQTAEAFFRKAVREALPTRAATTVRPSTEGDVA